MTLERVWGVEVISIALAAESNTIYDNTITAVMRAEEFCCVHYFHVVCHDTGSYCCHVLYALG